MLKFTKNIKNKKFVGKKLGEKKALAKVPKTIKQSTFSTRPPINSTEISHKVNNTVIVKAKNATTTKTTTNTTMTILPI